MRPRCTAGRVGDLRRPSAARSCTRAPDRNSAAPYSRPFDQRAVPGPDRHVGDRVVVAREVLAFRQAPVEHVELALHLHREAVDRVFDLGRRIGVEVAEAAAEVGRAAHLPEQPRQAFGARRGLGRQERAELLGEVQQDRAGSRRRGSASGRCGPAAPGSWSWD